MKRIDGRHGGGQLLRWAVAMASIAQEPIRVTNIRGARDQQGLRAQHVAAVTASAAFTNATVEGVEVGSESITYEPGPITGGETTVEVGTAGSIPLIFDTVLPFGLVADEPIILHATGGTDVKWSPPIDFHRYVKLPFLARYGVDGTIDIERRGFYPTGGGSATLTIDPASPTHIDCPERGELRSIDVYSIATTDLSDAAVAERQADAARDAFGDVAGTDLGTSVEYVEANSPGSVILVVVTYDHSIAGFSALGARGRPAEDVARGAVDGWRAFDATEAAIDSHLADQLLPFLAVGGGEITTPETTSHIETAVDLLAQFEYEFDITETEGLCRIAVE